MLDNKTNIVNVANHYLKALNVPFTQSYLRENILDHPYYPSLHCLSNVFKRYNVESDGFAVTNEEFKDLKPPFISYLKHKLVNKDFVLVIAADDNEVKYISEGSKIQITATEMFLTNWQNIVLVAAANDSSKEPDYKSNYRKEVSKRNQHLFFLATSLFVISSILYFFFHPLPPHQAVIAAFLVLVKFFGLAITVLLLIHQIDGSNSLVKKMCGSGKENKCDSILQSKASKLWGISWSDVGFFYFASSTLFLLSGNVKFENKLSLLAIANCLAAPYIIYSIFYQWKIAKQWCRLCLLVQSALAMELIWSLANFWQHPFFSTGFLLDNIYAISCSIIFPLLLLYSVKPLIIKFKNDQPYRSAFKRLAHNPEVFSQYLMQERSAPDGHEHFGITLGNPRALNTIIKVCNPYCDPCSKVHPILHDILHHNNDVKLKVIFNVSNDKKDKRGIIAKHLLSINESDHLQIDKAMDDWYLAEIKDYEKFALKYPVVGDVKSQEKQIEEMKTWCKKAEIKGTPTFFINGKKLPANYTMEDVKYIL